MTGQRIMKYRLIYTKLEDMLFDAEKVKNVTTGRINAQMDKVVSSISDAIRIVRKTERDEETKGLNE